MTSFLTLTHEPLSLQATEQRLTAIYEAAKKGLKGDRIAYAAGMKPSDYRRLAQMDPLVDMAVEKGIADGEMTLAGVLYDAATVDKDPKVALELLKHTRGWVAKQQIDVEVTQISVLKALEMANERVNSLPAYDPQVLEGVYEEKKEGIVSGTEGVDAPIGPLTTRLTESHDDYAPNNTSAP